MARIKVIILTNETEGDHILWENACKANSNINYRLVNLTKSNWLEEICKESCDLLLAKPGGVTASFKLLYDERLRILNDELKYKVFPSMLEVLIYENKKFLSYFLKANKINSPKTYIFYNFKEARDFIQKSKYPIVGKMNIGASGKGITIIKNINEGLRYIQSAFGSGLRLTFGPKLMNGQILKRTWRKITHPLELRERLQTYKILSSEIQKGFCIFQDYINHEYEWRVVRIGDSFFAHKKLVKGQMASGTLLKEYGNPPLSLLCFVKEITDKHHFRSLAIDIFESNEGEYLVNEMQCIFGQSDEFQMLVNNIAGRYRYIKDEWVFEKGLFNTNKSYDLRLETALSLIEEKPS